MSTHRKIFCVLLGFQLIIFGCSPHITDHCIEISEEIATPPDMRENYHPTLTPITDLAGECYCNVEDAAIVTVVAPILVVFAGIAVVAAIGGGESVGFVLDELIN